MLSASVFGSVARGDAGPDSDVVVRLSDKFSKGGFDYFGRMEELKKTLSAILGCKVDVIEEPVRKKQLSTLIRKYGDVLAEPSMTYFVKLASGDFWPDAEKESIRHASLQRRAVVAGIYGPEIYVTLL